MNHFVHHQWGSSIEGIYRYRERERESEVIYTAIVGYFVWQTMCKNQVIQQLIEGRISYNIEYPRTYTYRCNTKSYAYMLGNVFHEDDARLNYNRNDVSNASSECRACVMLFLFGLSQR